MGMPKSNRGQILSSYNWAKPNPAHDITAGFRFVNVWHKY